MSNLYNAINGIYIAIRILNGRSTLFLGKHFCELDKDSRFCAPVEFKRYLITEVYVTQGFEHNLLVLSRSAFHAIYKKLGNLNLTDPLARLLFRLILGAANELWLNDEGYIEIPEELLKYAHIDKEVLLIGQGDYFEIWSPKLWDKQEVELRNTETNCERFVSFEITTR